MRGRFAVEVRERGVPGAYRMEWASREKSLGWTAKEHEGIQRTRTN
jgi:hypothetical protein